MKKYQVEFYPLIMIEEAENEIEAEGLAINDIRMGECELEVKKITVYKKQNK